MKFGQDCAIVRERVGLCKPDRLGDHVVQVHELPGSVRLSHHALDAPDYLTRPLAIRDDVLKHFAELLAGHPGPLISRLRPTPSRCLSRHSCRARCRNPLRSPGLLK
jgi:hypothetical protein